MVTRGQAVDHGRDRVPCQVDARNARGVVAAARRTAHALVRIGGVEGATLEVVLEGETDRRTVGLEAAAARGRLADRTADTPAVVVEDQDVGRERVIGSKAGRIAAVA